MATSKIGLIKSANYTISVPGTATTPDFIQIDANFTSGVPIGMMCRSATNVLLGTLSLVGNNLFCRGINNTGADQYPDITVFYI